MKQIFNYTVEELRHIADIKEALSQGKTITRASLASSFVHFELTPSEVEAHINEGQYVFRLTIKE